jgi:DNA gyrase subunit A
MAVADLRVMGRNTQGVKLIRLKNEADEISSVTKIVKDPEEEVLLDAEVVETEGVVVETNGIVPEVEAENSTESTGEEGSSEE